MKGSCYRKTSHFEILPARNFWQSNVYRCSDGAPEVGGTIRVPAQSVVPSERNFAFDGLKQKKNMLTDYTLHTNP